jgi:hypothetical protein
MQTLVMTMLVAACFVYALWTLAPRAARRRLAQALLTWPLPAVLHRPLQAAARMQGGCGCDGCDQPGSTGAAVSPKPLVFMRKR